MNKLENTPGNEWLFPAGRSLIMGFVIFFLCMFLSQVVIQGIAWLCVGDRASAVMSGQELTGGFDLGVFRILSGLGNFLSWGVAGIIWAALNGKMLSQMRINQRPSLLHLLVPALAMMVSIPAMQALLLTPQSFELGGMHGLEKWAEAEEASRVGAIKTLLNSKSVGVLFANLIVIALIPAIAEEIFFRAGLQRNLERVLPAHAAVWVGAALFSALHFQFLGFLPRLILGAALGYSFQRSGSLWVSITAHFAFNGMTLFIGFLAVRGALPLDMMEPEYQFPLWAVMASAVCAAGLLVAGLWKKKAVSA